MFIFAGKTQYEQTIIYKTNIETKHNHLPRKEVVKYIVTELKL